MKKLLQKTMLLILFFLGIGQQHLWSQNAGNLDPSFGQGGLVFTDIQNLVSSSSSMEQYKFPTLIQEDGKMLSFYIEHIYGANIIFTKSFRYLSNGSIDPTWNYIEADTNIISLYDSKEQSDGKILVLGSTSPPNGGASYGVLARHLPDGSIDSSFGQNGVVYGTESRNFRRMLLVDDKIIVFGQYGDFYGNYIDIYSFNISDGSIDSTWGNYGKFRYEFVNGTQSTPIMGAQLANDGRMMMLYLDRVYCFLPDGQIDSSFAAGQGYLDPLYVRGASYRSRYNTMSITLQNDGKFILAGPALDVSNNGELGAVERYFPNGDIDSSFADNGLLFVDFRTTDQLENSMADIALLDNGDLIIAGSVKDSSQGNKVMFAMMKYNTDSNEIDSTFGINGIQRTKLTQVDSFDICHRVFIQDDQKIILQGLSATYNASAQVFDSHRFAMARYSSGNETSVSKENIANQTNIKIYPNPTSSFVNISSETQEINRVFVYNIQGQLLENISYPQASKEIQLDLSNFAKGIYFLEAQLSNHEKQIQKIILK